MKLWSRFNKTPVAKTLEPAAHEEPSADANPSLEAVLDVPLNEDVVDTTIEVPVESAEAIVESVVVDEDEPTSTASRFVVQCEDRNLMFVPVVGEPELNGRHLLHVYHAAGRTFDIGHFDDNLPTEFDHSVGHMGLWVGTTPQEVRCFGEELAEIVLDVDVSTQVLVVYAYDLASLPNTEDHYKALRDILLKKGYAAVGVRDDRGVQQLVLLTRKIFNKLHWK